MKRDRRGWRRLLWFAVTGLVFALVRVRPRPLDRVTRPAEPAPEPVAAPDPVATEPRYRGRIRIEPSAARVNDWSVEIDDPDRSSWRGTKLAPAAVTVAAHRYTVTLLDGGRQGQTATATVSYRYARSARSGKPETLQLNGKTSFG
jgi:hypothetical protein